MDFETKCPGYYCGRMPLPNDTFSDCGSCDRGWKRNDKFICVKCDERLELYDLLFLAFNIIVPFLIHLFLIDYTTKTPKKFSKEIFLLYLCAISEVGLSALLSVLLTDPKFSFEIHSCGVSSISDFYTYFFNPSPGYEKTLICTQERVYPLQTLVLIFYASCVFFMLLFRPIMNERFCKNKVERASLAIYYGLYAFPLLALIYAVAGGFIYFSFPYISIIISCAVNAGHFAMKQDQDTKQLLISSLTSIRNVIIIVGNWLLFSFGIVSIKKYYLLLLAPVPSIFYIITAKFTNPENY